MTAERYFEGVLTMPEAANILGRFSLESVAGRLCLLKHLNDTVFSDPDATPEELDGHVLGTLQFLFSNGLLLERALTEAKSDPKFRPVSDQAVLATLELALLCSRRDADHFMTTEDDRLALTHVILSFQSVLFSRKFQTTLEGKTSFESLGPEAWAEFLRNRMAHNTSRYYRHALGRLYALCCDPEIDTMVRSRLDRGVESFFVDSFGLTPTDYLICAFLSSAPAWQIDPKRPDASKLFFRENTFWQIIFAEQRAKLDAFLRLASREVRAVSHPPSVELDDYLFSANSAHVAPILNFGSFSLCISPHLLMNKFIIGLPYLAQEALVRKLGRPLTDDEVKACRAPFGILFECYVVWLFRKVLRGWTNIEIIPRVYYGPEKHRIECDLVIVRGDTAFIFEIKTKLATMAFRSTGAFEGLDSLLEPGARQVYRAARALRNGEAAREDASPIEGIRFVVPCVITYEDIPLFFPISEFYERHLEKKTQLPLFHFADGIEPVQFFDVDFLEGWERSFDLSPNNGAPFGYLLQRARRIELRHAPVQDGIVAGKRLEAPTPFDQVAMEAKSFLDNVARAWIAKETSVFEKQ